MLTAVSGGAETRYCIRCGGELPDGEGDAALCPGCAGQAAGATTIADSVRATEPLGKTLLDPQQAPPDDARSSAPTLAGARDVPAARAPVGQVWRPGQNIAGIYTVVRELGRGGMGVVHLAREGEVGRLVAIKSPLGEFIADTVAQRLFTREATAWMELGAHPNVVRAFDVQEIDYLPRILMEYCEGGTLKQRIARCSAGMGLQEAFEFGVQVCWGVEFAHAKGLIHRDLKPANVLLLSDGTAKVADFGLVRQVGVTAERSLAAGSSSGVDGERGGASASSLGACRGTPQYMAPEQWAGSGIGPGTDIYALGLILFELFTGRRAFDLATHPAFRGKDLNPGLAAGFYRLLHCEEAPLDPGELRPNLPAGVRELLLACLAKRSEERPASVVDVAARLAEALLPAGIDAARRPRPDRVVLDAEARRDRAWALCRLAQGALNRDALDDAERVLVQAQTLLDSLPDRAGRAVCSARLGVIHRVRGELDRAAELYREALAVFREVGDASEFAACTLSLGEVHCARGDYWRAAEEYNRALAISRELGDREGEAKCLSNLAVVCKMQGEYGDAVALLKEALRIREEIGDLHGVEACHGNLGNIHRARGEYREAAERHAKAFAIAREIGDRTGIAACTFNLGSVHFDREELDEARRCFEEALTIKEQLGDRGGGGGLPVQPRPCPDETVRVRRG